MFYREPEEKPAKASQSQPGSQEKRIQKEKRALIKKLVKTAIRLSYLEWFLSACTGSYVSEALKVVE
jgi:hypothetical protein